MKPILRIIRGVPGSGKSTLAQTFKCFHVEADMFHIEGGEYSFNLKNIGKAHDWCFDAFQTACYNGLDVCVSNTFCNLEHMKKYMETANAHGFDIEIHECMTEFGNIHSVPEDTLKHMKTTFTPVTDDWLNTLGIKATVIIHK